MRALLVALPLLAVAAAVNGLWPLPEVDITAMLAPPSAAHPFGTDELGRDVLRRLIAGLGLSLGVGAAVLVITSITGTLLGVISGWCGGRMDNALMRLTDIFLSFPGILMAICFTALAGPGVGNVILALGLMGWVGFARLARVQTLAVRREEYVQAATVCGVAAPLIVWRHVLPNIAAPLIVEGVFAMAGAMIAEAGLSFLGIGVQPPQPSLGAMLREGARYMLVAPHLVLAPGVALMLVVLALCLVGERARDHLDVRTRKVAA